MPYPNGQIPEARMVELGRGYDKYGLWKHLAPVGTAARLNELVRLGREKYGVTLRVTPGWNIYRPYRVQVQYRNDLGVWAARPGTSSHGGVYQGDDCMAVDVQNWSDLAATESQAWARFVALCRLTGFRVDFVWPQERWHIGDFDPWVVPLFASTPINPIPVPPVPVPEEEDMTPEQAKKLDEVHAWITTVERGGSGGVQVFQRVPGNSEWMIVDPTLPPLKADPRQDGYRVTTSVDLGRVWGRQYSGQGSEGVQLDRDSYNAQQDWARTRAAEYRASQVALIREATAGR